MIEVLSDVKRIEVKQNKQPSVEVLRSTKTVEVFTGAAQAGASLPDIIDLSFKAAYQNYYHEFTYVSGGLSLIEIWESASKVTKLFEKSFTYTSGSLTGLVITDILASQTLSKTLTYDGSGNLQTITRFYS